MVSVTIIRDVNEDLSLSYLLEHESTCLELLDLSRWFYSEPSGQAQRFNVGNILALGSWW